MYLPRRSVLAVNNWSAWVLPTAAECAAAVLRPFCSSMYPWYNKTLSGIPFDPIKDPERYDGTVPDVLCRLPPSGSSWPLVNPVTDPHTPVNETNLFGVCTNSNPPSPGQADPSGGGMYPNRWCGPARLPSGDSSKVSGYTYNFYADGASSSSASPNVRTQAWLYISRGGWGKDWGLGGWRFWGGGWGETGRGCEGWGTGGQAGVWDGGLGGWGGGWGFGQGGGGWRVGACASYSRAAIAEVYKVECIREMFNTLAKQPELRWSGFQPCATLIC